MKENPTIEERSSRAIVRESILWDAATRVRFFRGANGEVSGEVASRCLDGSWRVLYLWPRDVDDIAALIKLAKGDGG